VIKDYELVLREKKELEERLNEMKDRLGHFVNIEETLNKSIVIAQEAGEDVKRKCTKGSETHHKGSRKECGPYCK
jgi:cell division initiation protein